MKDLIKATDVMKPLRAAGTFGISLTDPATGKIVHEIKQKNHVYESCLLCGISGDWITSISGLYLDMTDYEEDIDTTLPYILGNTIGYGIPSTGSYGLYRGAYNAANQILAQPNGFTSMRWKFQYEFTPSQANGTIRRIGLTRQYADPSGMRLIKALPRAAYASGTAVDSKIYSCSIAGIVTITDLYTGEVSPIDVSAVVGTSGNKNVGYATDTGRYYIWVYNGTASSRKFYEFSDNTFSSLVNTYTLSNFTVNDSQGYAIYIYGNELFYVPNSGTITVFNYVTNTALASVTAPTSRILEDRIPGRGTPAYLGLCVIPHGKYLISAGSYYRPGAIFDMQAHCFCGSLASYSGSNERQYGAKNPLMNETVLDFSYSTSLGPPYSAPALAQQKLDTPVTKTSANGMTVTYELEVFW